MKASVKYEGIDDVVTEMRSWNKRVKKRAGIVCKNKVSPMLTKYAQNNRPWTDRTGNARRGLHTDTEIKTAEIVVALKHSVDYGVYLENSNSGKFAIVKPTLEANRQKVIDLLRGITIK